MTKKYICCCSGGKDSTTMFLKILELKKPLDLVVICDIKEEMDFLKHNQYKIKEICDKNGIECVLLNKGQYINKKGELVKYPCSFEYILFNHMKKFPIFNCRWCTDWLKVKPMREFMKSRFGKNKDAYYQYVGFAYDEIERTQMKAKIGTPSKNWLYPLIDLKLTEKDCYEIALKHGFKFDTRFERSGCWCCPLMSQDSVSKTIKYYPEKWAKIKEWEKKIGHKWKYNSTSRKGGCEYFEKKSKDNQMYIIDKDENNIS